MNNFGILTVITCPALVDSGCGKRPKITRVEIADEVAKRFQTLDIRFENLRIAFDRSVLSTNKSYFKLDLRIFAIGLIVELIVGSVWPAVGFLGSLFWVVGSAVYHFSDFHFNAMTWPLLRQEWQYSRTHSRCRNVCTVN